MMTRAVLTAPKVRLRGRFAAVSLFLLAACGMVWSQAVITKATIFKQIDKTDSLGFVVEIEGTNLNAPENPRVLLLPSTGITHHDPPIVTATLVTMSFTAPKTYVPVEVALSYSTGPVASAITGTECAPDVDVKKSYFLIPEDQVAKKYGHGISKTFDVLQVSIVNKCALPILVPLAGISLAIANPTVHAFSLEHVTSIFSNDRAFSGPRAILFNIFQGAATLGSAIQPFFGPGFTQGVSILGGGFTQGAATIWKDLSAEQLQNLTSQSFQGTEQIAASGGSLQKSVFIARTKKKANASLVGSLTVGQPSLDQLISMEVIPVRTAGGTP